MKNISNFYQKNYKVSNLSTLITRYHDIIVDDNYVFLIKIPHNTTWVWTGLLGLIGFLLFGFIGMALGLVAGGVLAKNKRDEFRTVWVSPEGFLDMQKIEKELFLKIPIPELEESILFHESKFHHSYVTFDFEGKKIRLQHSLKEIIRFKDFINKNKNNSDT